MTLNDQQIIDNTHFCHDDQGGLVCYTNLPDGSKFQQKVSSQEAVQKNMIGWCNTVRDYINMKAKQAEEERAAVKKRRNMDLPPPEMHGTVTPSSLSPKALVLEHWENLKDSRRNLKQAIEDSERELEEINKEMDALSPVIKAWKGVKGET